MPDNTKIQKTSVQKISSSFKLSSPEHLQQTLVKDLSGIKNVPVSVVESFVAEINKVLAVPPTSQSGYSLAVEIHDPETYMKVRVYYGISGIPDIFRPKTNKRPNNEQLCVLRTSLILQGINSKGFDFKPWTEMYPTTVYIYPTFLAILCRHAKATKAGQKEILKLAKHNFSPQNLFILAFLYRIFAERIPLENYIADMQVAAAGRDISRPFTKNSATFVISPDGRIVVGRPGTHVDTKRFLVAPGGQFVPLPEPGLDRGAKDLLPHQEKWLTKGDLASFQKACGVIPGKYSDWGPDTMNSVKAQIVRNELLICGSDLDR